MTSPYTVALVLDPNFGDRLNPVAERIHTWAVDSPINRAVAEKMWAARTDQSKYSIEKGITVFNFNPGANPEFWCKEILDTLDHHHNEMSHDPGYSILQVYGIKFSEYLRPYFVKLGFSEFEETSYGFRSTKLLTEK